MRCPKCNLEINPLSERCPNCGTSTKLAQPDGDTLTRVRRQIAVIKGETEVSDGEEPSDASFSPVLKFDRPEPPEQVIERNPADNFSDESFDPVDISGMIDSSGDGEVSLSDSIRRLVNNKEDDLLAEYYFRDGISDLERYRLLQSYRELEREGDTEPDGRKPDGRRPVDGEEKPGEGEMSESARRLSEFPEEKGLDKVMTAVWDRLDAARNAVGGRLEKVLISRLRRLYRKFDKKTSPLMDRALGRVYYSRFESLKRGRDDSEGEKYLLRRRVWCITGIVLAVALCGLIALTIMMKNDLNGKWVIATDSSGKANIVMEFKPGGRAVITVRSEDGWHVHKQGRYETQTKNGHELLTITYDDGSVKRLYYELDGRKGTFTNVDTNVQAVYEKK